MTEEIIEKNSSEIEIDVGRLLSAFFRKAKKLWLIFPLSILLLGAIGGYVTAVSYTPKYTSTATYTITLDDLPDNFYGQTAAKSLVATFPYLLQSSDLDTLVCRDLGVETLDATIKADVLTGTNIITISVEAKTPKKAYDTLCSVIKIYPDIAVYVVGNTTLKLIIPPSQPTEPSNSVDLLSSICLYAAGGLALAILIVVAIAIIRPTFNSVEEVKKVLKIDRVSVLPKINLSSKVKQNLTIKDKTVNRVFYDSIGRFRTSVTHSARHRNIKVIMVTSTLQGEGKTTVSANLALSLASHGHKTLLIDCDLRNPSVMPTLGYKELAVPFSDVIKGKEKLSACVIRENQYLDVLCEKSFNNDAAELISSDFVSKLIKAAREKYDYVILDTAPLTAAADGIVLSEQADGTVYVIRRDYAPAAVVSENIEKFRYSKAKPFNLVLNMANSGAGGTKYYGNYSDYYRK